MGGQFFRCFLSAINAGRSFQMKHPLLMSSFIACVQSIRGPPIFVLPPGGNQLTASERTSADNSSHVPKGALKMQDRKMTEQLAGVGKCPSSQHSRRTRMMSSSFRCRVPFPTLSLEITSFQEIVEFLSEPSVILCFKLLPSDFLL